MCGTESNALGKMRSDTEEEEEGGVEVVVMKI